MKIKAIVLSVFAAVAVSCGVSKDHQIEKEFAEIMERNKAVGLAVAAVKDGKLVYNGELDMNYKSIKLDGSNIVVNSDDKIYVQTVDGDVKFDQTIDMAINEIICMNGGYEYILITNESIDEIALK